MLSVIESESSSFRTFHGFITAHPRLSVFSAYCVLSVHYSGKNLNNDEALKEFSAAKTFIRAHLWSQLHGGKTQMH